MMNRRDLIRALAVTATAAPLAMIGGAQAEPVEPDELPVTFAACWRDDYPREALCAWLVANGVDPGMVREMIVYGDRTLALAVFKLNSDGRKYAEPGSDHVAMEYPDRRLVAPVPPQLAAWYRNRHTLAEEDL